MSLIFYGVLNLGVHAYLDSTWYQVFLSYLVILAILAWEKTSDDVIYAQANKKSKDAKKVAHSVRRRWSC